MSDIILRFVGAPVYEGKPGWPAKDLTQAELDARGLDKAVMLAYRPKLYEEVGSEIKKKSRRRHRRADPQIQPGGGPDDDESDVVDSRAADPGLHPGEIQPGED